MSCKPTDLLVERLRRERVYHKVVEVTTNLGEDGEARYHKARGVMEALEPADLELLEDKMRKNLRENDRILIREGVYTEDELSTENVSQNDKWNHNCIRLARLFSMYNFVVTKEEKTKLERALLNDTIFLEPLIIGKILA